MRIGVVGLGKVGLVLAQVLRYHGGHDVMGYDIQSEDEVLDRLDSFPEPVHRGTLDFAEDITHLVSASDVVYVCVATPTPPDTSEKVSRWSKPQDFDYSHLESALTDISVAATDLRKDITVVVLSTVAPGTFANRLTRLVSYRVTLVYSPSFISLGSIERDLLDPYALLVGADDNEAHRVVAELWRSVFLAKMFPLVPTTIAEAEVIKMASNAIQFMKIQYVNSLVPLCDHVNADIDVVTMGLRLVHEHGWVPRAGMPDGGACRPRDMAAMSAVFDAMGPDGPVNVFDDIAQWRLDQFDHMATEVAMVARVFDLPIIVCGAAYKPGVYYQDGSPGVMLARLIKQNNPSRRVDLVDTYVPMGPAVYVLALPVTDEKMSQFPAGSTVYDVLGCTQGWEVTGVRFMRPGRRDG
jgi:UDPglucose 6-dehydrogenase